ncbi:MAG: acyl carrier protein [Myxococcales bacterium]|nr:acyl carrier protein [Myxococcales bacterium]
MTMTPAQARQRVAEALARVAPEIDLADVEDDVDLREELDIDSMDFRRFVIELCQALAVDIPEADYGRLATLGGAIEYVRERVASA